MSTAPPGSPADSTIGPESTIGPGSTIGVLGGGQLGRMLALTARRMGYQVSVFAPEANTPTEPIAHQSFQAEYTDLEAVAKFASSVSAVTFEFENVPAATAEAAARHAPLRPAGTLLQAAQDRLLEKNTLRKLGLPVADFLQVEDRAEAEAAARDFVGRGVMKTATSGYDGKGQRAIKDPSDILHAWEQLGSRRCVLEAWIPFEREISVVGARAVDGSIELFDPFENAHANHVLDVTSFPARVAETVRRNALEIARTVLEGLDVVGVLCVELFCLENGDLLVNEIAPRPHNSGHLTIDAHETCQFEQQLRAVCGLPLGSTQPTVKAAAMANLLGDLWNEGTPNFAAALALPGIRLHLYGKQFARPGRKMGHLVATANTREEAEQRVREARSAL